VLFADRTFPAASTTLRAAAPDLEVTVGPVDGVVEADVVVPLLTRIDGEFMDRTKGLRLIQQWGAGLEGVDVGAATERGIMVGNVPSAATGNAGSVAEWCVMAALGLSRRLTELGTTIRTGGQWGGPLGRAMAGRTAVIVGFGGIGRALAQRLRGFDLTLHAVTRTPDPTDRTTFGLAGLSDLTGLRPLLPQCDYLFLCLPLTPDTAGLVDAAALDALPPDAIVVNAGRGKLIDEDALLAALRSGRLGGAALDVFATEPLDPASPLLREPNVLATPHIAGVTDLSYRNLAAHVTTYLDQLRAAEPLVHCVNWPGQSQAVSRPST